jgi:hypothetical protein
MQGFKPSTCQQFRASGAQVNMSSSGGVESTANITDIHEPLHFDITEEHDSGYRCGRARCPLHAVFPSGIPQLGRAGRHSECTPSGQPVDRADTLSGGAWAQAGALWCPSCACVLFAWKAE